MALSQAPTHLIPFLVVLEGTRHVPVIQPWHLLSPLPTMLPPQVSVSLIPSLLLEPLLKITFLIPLLIVLLVSAPPHHVCFLSLLS